MSKVIVVQIGVEVMLEPGLRVTAETLEGIAQDAGRQVARVVDSRTAPCPVCGINTLLGDICAECRKAEPDPRLPEKLDKTYWIRRKVEELDWLAEALGATPAQVEADLQQEDRHG